MRAVFHDRLRKVDWMSEATRAKALAKFDRFTQKVGYPDKFRDYSKVVLRPEVDEFVVLEEPPMFYAVGAWYEDFSQTTDDEVRDLLKRGTALDSGTSLPRLG